MQEMKMNMENQFQFLIGQLQTLEENYTIIDLEKFQFLIGQLQTFSVSLTASFLITFQFLIGQLQTTEAKDKFQERKLEFQFLIGQLQTHGQAAYFHTYCPVSIPYRLATNKLEKAKLYTEQHSFNSLQVSYKQGYERNKFN